MRTFLVKKTDLNVKKGYIDFASKIIGMIDRKAKAIRAKCWHNIGANSSKMYLVRYSSYGQNKI